MNGRPTEKYDFDQRYSIWSTLVTVTSASNTGVGGEKMELRCQGRASEAVPGFGDVCASQVASPGERLAS